MSIKKQIEKSIDFLENEIEKSEIMNQVVELNRKIYSNETLLWKMYNVAIWEKIYAVKI